MDANRTFDAPVLASFLLGAAEVLFGCGPSTDVGNTVATEASTPETESSSATDGDTSGSELAWLFDTFSSIRQGEGGTVVAHLFHADGTVAYNKDSCFPRFVESGTYKWDRISDDEVEVVSNDGSIVGFDFDRTRVTRRSDCDEFDLEGEGPNTGGPIRLIMYRGKFCLSELGTEDCEQSRGTRCAENRFDCSPVATSG